MGTQKPTQPKTVTPVTEKPVKEKGARQETSKVSGPPSPQKKPVEEKKQVEKKNEKDKQKDNNHRNHKQKDTVVIPTVEDPGYQKLFPCLGDAKVKLTKAQQKEIALAPPVQPQRTRNNTKKTGKYTGGKYSNNHKDKDSRGDTDNRGDKDNSGERKNQKQ